MALRRWLVLQTETETSWCPDWYAVIQAARYLSVAPWELAQQPIFWRDKAFLAMTAEKQARDILGQNKQQ